MKQTYVIIQRIIFQGRFIISWWTKLPALTLSLVYITLKNLIKDAAGYGYVQNFCILDSSRDYNKMKYLHWQIFYKKFHFDIYLILFIYTFMSCHNIGCHSLEKLSCTKVSSSIQHSWVKVSIYKVYKSTHSPGLEHFGTNGSSYREARSLAEWSPCLEWFPLQIHAQPVQHNIATENPIKFNVSDLLVCRQANDKI